MKGVRFQNKVAASRFTLPAAVLLATLLWCAEGTFTPDRMLGWAVCLLTAYIWTETNNTYLLIRVRTRLTPAVFLWMTGCIFSLHPLQEGAVVSCLMLVSYHLLFKSYRRREAAVPLFHSFLCLGTGSLLFPQLLFFAPFYLWYAGADLRSLTWRTFWASLTGLALPYWFAAAYFLYTGDFGRLAGHFRKLALFQPVCRESYLHLDFLQACAAGLVAAFTLTAAVHCLRTGFNDKIRTRVFLRLILTQELLVALFMALQPEHFQVLLAPLVMNSAPVLSHYFALASGRFALAVSVLFLSAFAALSFLNVWALL